MTPAAPETPAAFAAPKTADATAAPAAPAAPARLQLCEPGSGAGPGPRAAASAAAAAAAAGDGGELRGGVPAEASLVKYTLLVHSLSHSLLVHTLSQSLTRGRARCRSLYRIKERSLHQGLSGDPSFHGLKERCL